MRNYTLSTERDNNVTRVFKLRRTSWKAPEEHPLASPAGELGGGSSPSYRLWRRGDPEVSPCTVCKGPCKIMRLCPECSIKGCNVCRPEWTGRFCPECTKKYTQKSLDENSCPSETGEYR